MKKIFIDKIKTNSDSRESSRQFKRRKLYKSIKSVKLKRKKFSKKKKAFNLSKRIIIIILILVIIFLLFSIIIKSYNNIRDANKTIYKINIYKNNDNLHNIYNNNSKLIIQNSTIYLNNINETNNLSDYDIKAIEIYSTYGYLSFKYFIIYIILKNKNIHNIQNY